MKVERVWHRRDAIWPSLWWTGSAEDTMFGEIIHELTGPDYSTVLRGSRVCTLLMQPVCIRCFGYWKRTL